MLPMQTNMKKKERSQKKKAGQESNEEWALSIFLFF